MAFFADESLIIGFYRAGFSRLADGSKAKRVARSNCRDRPPVLFHEQATTRRSRLHPLCLSQVQSAPRRAFPLKALRPLINKVLAAVGLMYTLASKLVCVFSNPVLPVRIDV